MLLHHCTELLCNGNNVCGVVRGNGQKCWYTQHLMPRWKIVELMCCYSITLPGGGVLDFGLDGGVPPGPRDPNPCLE